MTGTGSRMALIALPARLADIATPSDATARNERCA
jgi:hypothetical protein